MSATVAEVGVPACCSKHTHLLHVGTGVCAGLLAECCESFGLQLTVVSGWQ